MKRPQNNILTAGQRTKDQILDTAEMLFATDGPEAVSIRGIANEAGINLGAVNYHFGSKEKLFEEMFRRRVLPLNEQRLALLDSVDRQCRAGEAPPLEAIIKAFAEPPLRLAAEAAGKARAMVVMQFLSHAFSSPNEDAFLKEYYEPVRTRFIDLLQRALPHLSLEDVLWRYNFMVGSIIYAMGGASRMTRPPKGRPLRINNSEQAILEFVAYAAAGFRAPPASKRSSARQ